jgi:diacylglycerol kinase (ATP)
VHEVAAACVGTQRTLGVLPVGSGNCYVKALGVETNLGRALEVPVRGNTHGVAAGEANGVLFNDGLGTGFDAEVAARVARAPKYLGGIREIPVVGAPTASRLPVSRGHPHAEW